MQQVYVENLHLSIYLFCSLIKRGGSFIPSPLPDFISLGVAWGWGWRGSGCHVTVSYEPCTQALGDSICYPQITGKYSHMQTIQAIFACTLTLPRGNFHHIYSVPHYKDFWFFGHLVDYHACYKHTHQNDHWSLLILMSTYHVIITWHMTVNNSVLA